MFNSQFLYLAVALLVSSVTAFVPFENGMEYEFRFKSKLNLEPSFLTGQSGNATLIVRKFGTDGSSLVVRIKDSEVIGKNVDSETKGHVEGIFGVKRDVSGAITHIISKSNSAKEVLTKKNIVSMLSDDFSFFDNYVRSTASRKKRERVDLSIGWCNCDISAETDDDSGLTNVLAQTEIRNCDVNPLIIKAGQYLLQGTTKTIARIEEDSNIGMSIMFDTKTKQMLEVNKFTFLNLVIMGIEVQARHNMILEYVGEHPVTSETDFGKPYSAFSKEDIDDFIREQKEED
ncbi:uncharacterized protein LOC119080074 [Bradysia coprophila]|uniref:uncharacterized protein LOC119080074 n=1 Tax=Bradysia coprophila TaxID=38358 RepID=UPI00187DC9B3|nr:uncharacterized protein LOC119080074 [Bradysia coprophila]